MFQFRPNTSHIGSSSAKKKPRILFHTLQYSKKQKKKANTMLNSDTTSWTKRLDYTTNGTCWITLIYKFGFVRIIRRPHHVLTIQLLMHQLAALHNNNTLIHIRRPAKEVTRTIPIRVQNVTHTHRPLNVAVKPDPEATITPPIVHRPPDHVLVITATALPHLVVCHMETHTDTTHTVSKSDAMISQITNAYNHTILYRYLRLLFL